MTTAAHTQGPWRIAHSGYANTPFVVYVGSKEPQFANRNRYPLQGVNWIAEVNHDESEQHREQIANVQLIASAPMLLAELESIATRLELEYQAGDPEAAEGKALLGIAKHARSVIARATVKA